MRTLDLPVDLPAELAIGEVAEATGVSAHTLRYYERIGLSRSVVTPAAGGSMTPRRWLGWSS